MMSIYCDYNKGWIGRLEECGADSTCNCVGARSKSPDAQVPQVMSNDVIERVARALAAADKYPDDSDEWETRIGDANANRSGEAIARGLFAAKTSGSEERKVTKWIVCGGRFFGRRQFEMSEEAIRLNPVKYARLVEESLEETREAERALEALLVVLGTPEWIIEGGAKGADAIARLWASKRRIRRRTFEADWVTLGKRAGIIRNGQMAREPGVSLCVAFPGNKGTGDMIYQARREGIDVVRFGRLEGGMLEKLPEQKNRSMT